MAILSRPQYVNPWQKHQESLPNWLHRSLTFERNKTHVEHHTRRIPVTTWQCELGKRMLSQCTCLTLQIPVLHIYGIGLGNHSECWYHDDIIKWKHFPRYWPFVCGLHRSLENSAHKGQWRGTLMFSLICVPINGWVNSRHAGDLRRYRAHYDVTLMP